MRIDKIYIYTDGGSRGNPGSAAIGITLLDEQKSVLEQYRECIGETTNNVAEYKAIIKALEIATAHTREEVYLFSDSELVIKQLSGSYRIKKGHLRELFYLIKEREKAFKKVIYSHLNRENKFIAMSDKLVNEALDNK